MCLKYFLGKTNNVRALGACKKFTGSLTLPLCFSSSRCWSGSFATNLFPLRPRTSGVKSPEDQGAWA